MTKPATPFPTKTRLAGPLAGRVQVAPWREDQRSCRSRLLTILLAALLSGCTTGTPSPTPRPTVRIDGLAVPPDTAATPPPPSIEQTIQSDPCAARLHEISGALLEYYALQARLPKRLEDLQPLADPGSPLTFTCPTTNQPYVYTPAGLRAADDPGRTVIVHDPTPDAAGGRWAVLLQKPRGRQAPATLVLFLTDAAFRNYAPAPSTTAPAKE